MDENLNKILKNTGALLKASRAVSLKVIREKTENVIMSRHQNAAPKLLLINPSKMWQNSNIWKR